jgi:hypothetical protein
VRRGRIIRALPPGALLALALLLPPDVAAQAPQVGGCGVFPAFTGAASDPSADDQTAWNQDVSVTPRHPRSSRYMRRIRRLGGNQELHPDFGSNPDYGIPFEVVPQSQTDIDVEIGPDGYPDESDFGPAPVPADASIEGGSDSDGDRHVLVVQEGDCDLYELYRAFPDTGDDWIADSTAFWDLGSAGLNGEGDTSADAAGLPILPGLVRYEEVAAGEVAHAIRATFSRTRRAYIHPATHYASSACGRNLPPMGLRLRLKQGYFDEHLADFPTGEQARPIFVALRRYGMIVADNGSNWFFTGASSGLWDDEELEPLKDVPGRAFVVVATEDGVTTPC